MQPTPAFVGSFSPTPALELVADVHVWLGALCQNLLPGVRSQVLVLSGLAW